MAFGPFDRVRDFWRQWPEETRFALGIVGTCGAAVLVLSTVYVRSNLTSPFRVPTATLNNARTALQEINASDRTLEAERQRGKDTDRDGLNDYAELNTYKTSPYLADTDSDAIADAIEIAQGTDPNCPSGQTCGAIANADLQPGYSVSSSFSNLLDGTEIRGVGEDGKPVAATAAEEFILNAPEPGTINAARARELLVQSGLIPADELAAMNDAGLLQIYQATYAQVLKIREGLKNPTQPTP
jgi:hypothetical protein